MINLKKKVEYFYIPTIVLTSGILLIIFIAITSLTTHIKKILMVIKGVFSTCKIFTINILAGTNAKPLSQ